MKSGGEIDDERSAVDRSGAAPRPSFCFAGSAKLVLPLDQMTGPVALPGRFLRFLGMAEVFGAFGLVLPASARPPGPDPAAAAGLVIIMIGATVVTLVGGMVCRWR